jgi:hypothetical protein
MCKVTRHEVTFTGIMKNYRLQPQAKSHVYRSVLLSEGRSRQNSGTASPSGSASPSDDQPTTNKEGIRSSSTLPVANSNSLPATPTRMSGSGSQFEFGEERGDVIMFYNQVYVPEMKEYILKFSMTVSDKL